MIRSISLTRLTTRLLFLVPFAALLYNPSPGLATAFAPSLGSASSFAVLGGPAVTCTNSTVFGDVGSAFPGSKVTQTTCTINGTVHQGDAVAKRAYDDFLSAYTTLQYHTPCEHTLTGDLAGVTLTKPGVYCFDAAATLTGTLTLKGDSNAVWIFKIGAGTDGTGGTGALTTNKFTVVMEGGGLPCNVYWWVAEAATLNYSIFQGTILAGAAITVNYSTLTGDALAKAAVTLTGSTVSACEATGGGGNVHGKCNQGVGNGPEGCDPGNSNNHNPSNDERGGTRGNPGRKVGNR